MIKFSITVQRICEMKHKFLYTGYSVLIWKVFVKNVWAFKWGVK